MTERPEGTPEEAAAPEIEPAEPEIEPEAAEQAAMAEPEAAERAAMAEPEPAQPAAAAAAVVGTAKRREAAPATPPRAPTPSEVATRVTDPASRIFVIGSVVVFVAILVFGLVGGHRGLLTPAPTHRPSPSVSAAPSPSPSAAPSVSAAPSRSAAPSATASPSPS